MYFVGKLTTPDILTFIIFLGLLTVRLGEEYKYLAVDEDLHEDLIPALAMRVSVFIRDEDFVGKNISQFFYLYLIIYYILKKVIL